MDFFQKLWIFIRVSELLCRAVKIIRRRTCRSFYVIINSNSIIQITTFQAFQRNTDWQESNPNALLIFVQAENLSNKINNLQYKQLLQKQRSNCRFSISWWTNNGGYLSSWNREIEIFQHILKIKKIETLDSPVVFYFSNSTWNNLITVQFYSKMPHQQPLKITVEFWRRS